MALIQVFLDYGFLTYGTKRIAENRDDITNIGLVSSAITFLRLLLCLVMGLVVVVLAEEIPLLSENKIYVAIAYFGVCCKATLPDYVFQGQEDMGIITRRFVGSQAVAVVLIFAFVHGPADILLVPLFEGIASLIALIWSWANVLIRRGIHFCKAPKSVLKEVFKASTVFFISSAATSLYSSLTTLLIGIFIFDVAQVSYWSISISIIAALQSLFYPITNSLYPYMCANRDFEMVKRLLLIGTPVVAIVTICLFVFSSQAMLIVGGLEYEDGAIVLSLLSPVLLLSYPAILLGFPVLAAFDSVGDLTKSSSIAAVFHLVGLGVLLGFNWFAIPTIAILRCCTEAVLLAMRTCYVIRARKQVAER